MSKLIKRFLAATMLAGTVLAVPAAGAAVASPLHKPGHSSSPFVHEECGRETFELDWFISEEMDHGRCRCDDGCGCEATHNFGWGDDCDCEHEFDHGIGLLSIL